MVTNWSHMLLTCSDPSSAVKPIFLTYSCHHTSRIIHYMEAHTLNSSNIHVPGVYCMFLEWNVIIYGKFMTCTDRYIFSYDLLVNCQMKLCSFCQVKS